MKNETSYYADDYLVATALRSEGSAEITKAALAWMSAGIRDLVGRVGQAADAVVSQGKRSSGNHSV